MRWEGSVIKESAVAQGLSLVQLAAQIGVSRQAVNDWIKGQVPKGLYLITLCDILHLDPDDLFIKDIDNSIQIPVYKTKRKQKLTSDQQEKMKHLAERYKKLFKQNSIARIQPTVVISELNQENAKIIAGQMRKLADVQDDTPIDYKHIFDLLKRLDIFVIFCDFPVSKLYAFFTRIYNYRVVFIDTKTNVLDLIFPLIHETVHSILRDNKNLVIDDQEEDFCDMVASYAQFPEKYIQEIYKMIHTMEPGIQVNILKEHSQMNHHAICGVIKRIQKTYPDFKLGYAGADNNLRKKYPLISNILHASDNVRQFIHSYRKLSPLFIDIVLGQVENLSPRILGELFSLENYLDMVSLKDELIQLKIFEVAENQP